MFYFIKKSHFIILLNNYFYVQPRKGKYPNSIKYKQIPKDHTSVFIP